MVKLLFLGLDGATWTLLDPLIEAGELPHLARLKREGRAGLLRTSDPPYTFPAWKVLSSGQPPERLGVYGWIGVDLVGQRFTYPDARWFNVPEAWDYLAAAGLKVATVNMPATWPVREIKNGVMAAGPFARDERVFAPADAPARYGLGPYSVEDTQAFRGSAEGALALMQRLEAERFDVSERLAREVDVLFHTVFFCDPMQHFHWHDAKTMRAVWRWLDTRIGKLIEAAAPDHIVVASDHGFTPVAVQFNVNSWLAEQGLLALEGADATGAMFKLGITRERVLKFAGVFGLTGEDLAKVVPLKLRRGVPNEDGELAVNRLALVDWHRTRALSADGFQLFVKDKGARDHILAELPRLRLPGTGEPAFERVWDAAAAAGDPMAPVVVTPRDGVLLAHKFGGPVWRTDEFSAGWQATHALHGVLILHGQGIEPGGVDGAELLDIAPTLLALAGAGAPRSMTGKVLAGDQEEKPVDDLPPPFG